MDDIKLKKEVVEKIKSSTNILITVSNDPSVDALSAALGLTLALNKIEKYATAIYSGETPPAITFLEPEKTFEHNTDSLRDFIIALNREKADHLKFKPDGDYVKIFITPYRTTIKPEDLEFSQGDYNVELVIALGVDNQDHLDGALDSNGQILHDATIITMTVGDMTSSLGGIDWHDAQSSSLSEMCVGLVEALKDDAKAAIIEGPIATAFLTGIVAQTDRFSNSYTTSKVMTVAANLMTAGADQQLVAFKLQESREISQDARAPQDDAAETVDISTENAYAIPREDTGSEASTPEDATQPQDEEQSDAPEEHTDQPSTESDAPEVASTPSVTSAYAVDDQEVTTPEAPVSEDGASDDGPSHAYIAGPSPLSAYAPEPEEPAPNGNEGPEGFPGTPDVAPGSVTVNDVPAVDTILSHEEPQGTTAASDTPAETPVDVPAATDAPVPAAAIPGPADLGLPLPPPLPDFSAAGFNPSPAPAIPIPDVPQPERLGDILAPEPTAPQVTPEAPQAPDGQPADAIAPPSNPGQFQIPPQA